MTRRTCVHAHRNMYTIARIGSRRCCGFFITIHLSDDALAARACYITLAMLDAVPTLGQFFCAPPRKGEFAAANTAPERGAPCKTNPCVVKGLPDTRRAGRTFGEPCATYTVGSNPHYGF